MKIGISINYKKINNLTSILKDTGVKIQHVQINGLPAEINKISNDLIEEVKKFHSENIGIELSFHAYPFNFAERVEKVKRVWIDLAKETIGLAKDLKASFVNFHAGYGIDAGTRIEHDTCRELVVLAIQELVETSQHYGMEIHFENLYSEHRNSDFTKIGDRVSDFKYFFDVVSNPLFKLCYDYGHGNLDEHGIDILRNFPDRLGSIHAHDNDQRVDIHWPIGNKNLGTIDWDKEIEFLRNIEFDGPFILECDIEDQIIALEYLKSKRFFEKWIIEHDSLQQIYLQTNNTVGYHKYGNSF